MCLIDWAQQTKGKNQDSSLIVFGWLVDDIVDGIDYDTPEQPGKGEDPVQPLFEYCTCGHM